jgi:hypothetical protein
VGCRKRACGLGRVLACCLSADCASHASSLGHGMAPWIGHQAALVNVTYLYLVSIQQIHK